MHRNVRILLCIIVLWIICTAGRCDITVKPVDTEVLLGDSTYLNCSTTNPSEGVNWYHYPAGELGTDHRYVFAENRILSPYDKRYRIEANTETGSFNLIIGGVEHADAGLYVCQNGGDYGLGSQLIVLESTPICETNIDSSGFIGPNDCGLQINSIELSCRLKYRGNIPPKLRWALLLKNEASSHFSDEICRNVPDEVVCSITVRPEIQMNGSRFVCSSSRSRSAQPYYTSDIIEVHYAFNNSERVDALVGEDVTCSDNTNSAFCDYAWIWFDGVDNVTVSENKHLKVDKHGWHRCVADCQLKENICRLNAMLIKAKEKEAEAPSFTLIAIVFTMISILPTALITGCLLWRKITAKSRTSKSQTDIEVREPLLKAEHQRQIREIKEQHKKETAQQKGIIDELAKIVYRAPKELKKLNLRMNGEITCRPRGEERLPCGLTSLKNTLYVVCDGKPFIDIYDLNTLNFRSEVKVDGLSDPGDIKSCKNTNRLFIVNWARRNESNVIFVLDQKCKVEKHWQSDPGECRLSVSMNSTLVVTNSCQNNIVEYKVDGNGEWKIINKILGDTVGANLWHSVKVIGGFAVSYGKASMYGGVSIVDDDGYLLRSFEGIIDELGKCPAYLELRPDRSFIVVPERDAGVFQLDSCIEGVMSQMLSPAELGSGESRILRNVAFSFEEKKEGKKKEQLLLIDCRPRKTANGPSKWEDGRILLFDIIQ